MAYRSPATSLSRSLMCPVTKQCASTDSPRCLNTPLGIRSAAVMIVEGNSNSSGPVHSDGASLWASTGADSVQPVKSRPNIALPDMSARRIFRTALSERFPNVAPVLVGRTEELIDNAFLQDMRCPMLRFKFAKLFATYEAEAAMQRALRAEPQHQHQQ